MKKMDDLKIFLIYGTGCEEKEKQREWNEKKKSKEYTM